MGGRRIWPANGKNRPQGWNALSPSRARCFASLSMTNRAPSANPTRTYEIQHLAPQGRLVAASGRKPGAHVIRDAHCFFKEGLK